MFIATYSVTTTGEDLTNMYPNAEWMYVDVTEAGEVYRVEVECKTKASKQAFERKLDSEYCVTSYEELA